MLSHRCEDENQINLLYLRRRLSGQEAVGSAGNCDNERAFISQDPLVY